MATYLLTSTKHVKKTTKPHNLQTNKNKGKKNENKGGDDFFLFEPHGGVFILHHHVK